MSVADNQLRLLVYALGQAAVDQPKPSAELRAAAEQFLALQGSIDRLFSLLALSQSRRSDADGEPRQRSVDKKQMVIDVQRQQLRDERQRLAMLRQELDREWALLGKAQSELRKEAAKSTDPDAIHAAAVAVGTLGGKKGGVARALALTPERRSEIAQLAAESRWGKTASA